MEKIIFIDIKNNNRVNSEKYRADKNLAKKIVDDIASDESFLALMEVLGDK